jgi:hypothetical protein
MLARLYVFAVFVAAAVLLTYVAAQDKVVQPEPAKQPTVEQLIARLGDKDFQTREAAHRALLERPEALPALRKALSSDDAEIRRAAATLLEELGARGRQGQVKRALNFLDKGEVDTFVDLVTAMEPPLEDEIWMAMCAFVKKVAAATGGTANLPQIREFTESKPSRDCSVDKDIKRYTRYLECRLVAQELPKRVDFNKCLVVCKGKVEAQICLDNTILFSNGDFAPCPTCQHSALILDSPTRPRDRSYPFVCFIIVRGKDGAATVNIDGYQESVQQKVRELVRFFDPSQLGIETAEAKGGVLVKKVLDGKPFAAAGVKLNDVVTALDGVAVDSPESFRKLLRGKRALGVDCVIQLRRDDSTKELRLRLQD